MLVTMNLSRIRGRIAEVGIRQADLAAHLEIHETLLNAILRGRRPMPEGFEARVHETLDLLEQANQVAEAARRGVMEGTEAKEHLPDPREEMGDQLLKLDEVLALTGLSKSTLYRLVERGEFPRPVKLSPRVARWRAEEVEGWVNARRCGV